MEEKIIDGKFKRSTAPLIICGIAVFCIVLFSLIEAGAMREDYAMHKYTMWSPPSYYKDAGLFAGLYNLICWYAKSDFIFVPLLYLSFLTIIISLIIFFQTKGCKLTVSTTRVVGKASFGKRVDLPINQISAIGLGRFSSISISTSSGRVSFWLLQNRTEVHNALSNQIAKLQSQTTSTSSSETSINPVDELKKYKELLDAGVISQEEFDAKKKQLLGL